MCIHVCMFVYIHYTCICVYMRVEFRWQPQVLFLGCCDFIVSLTHLGSPGKTISVKHCLNKVGLWVCLMDCLVDVNWCVMKDLIQCGEHHSLSLLFECIRMKCIVTYCSWLWLWYDWLCQIPATSPMVDYNLNCELEWTLSLLYHFCFQDVLS